jgi:tetrahydromethanopterin S-methyltransferase subunit D
MKTIKKIFSLVLAILAGLPLWAQDSKVEMADLMRSNGKIYIVVAICLTILIGLFLYVWNVDRKISSIEKEKVS